jgi:hypothetical protein
MLAGTVFSRQELAGDLGGRHDGKRPINPNKTLSKTA